MVLLLISSLVEPCQGWAPPIRESGGGFTGLRSDSHELLKVAFETNGVFEVRLGYGHEGLGV